MVKTVSGIWPPIPINHKHVLEQVLEGNMVGAKLIQDDIVQEKHLFYPSNRLSSLTVVMPLKPLPHEIRRRI